MPPRLAIASLVLALLNPAASTAQDADAAASGGVQGGTPGRLLAPPPARAGALRLAILPDRTTGSDWGLRYLRLAVEDLNRIGPDAVISIGDMIQGYTRSVDRWDAEAAEFLDIIKDLRMPFYPLAGNHEVVSGERRRDDLRFQTKYQERFGPLYYTLNFDLATVIVLYSDDPTYQTGHGIGDAQKAWLMGALEKASFRNRPIVVLLHRPLWRLRESNWSDQIHPMMVDAGVDIVIAGHLHSMQRDPDRDGVQYHIVAVCGGTIDQHPLGGQFQHLTFITIEQTGGFRLYHQPVGTTLPDDFVRRVDQDRVYRLKTTEDAVRFPGPVPDPTNGEVDSTIDVALRNPLDVPLTFTVHLVDAAPEPETWADALWLSRMRIDRFNRYVTDVETTFRLAQPFDPVALEPGDEKIVQMRVTSPKSEEPRNPPEFHITASFVDSSQRSVPVLLRKRLPLERIIALDDDGSSAWWPLCAWTFNVYDRVEPNPKARFRVGGGRIEIELAIQDDVRSAFVPQDPDPARRWFDPLADAIVIEVHRGEEIDRFFCEPFVAEELWRIDGLKAIRARGSVELLENPDSNGVGASWGAVVRLPFAGGDGDLRINLGVADNDDTYHTQWRWLAPALVPAAFQIRTTKEQGPDP